MTAFSTVTPTPAPLDPGKHVNFTLGMVLGVDDFGQQFAYHSGRDQWLARDLIGAGTVRGLGLSISSDSTEVVVSPGMALTPQGEIVSVHAAQCAVLSDWVTTNATTVATALEGATLGTLLLYVVLRYKSCLTDPVPIPGEPCRSEADAMAPSRVKDSFQLDLQLSPPAPTEAPGMRAVLSWLAQIPVVASSGTATPVWPKPLLDALWSTFGPSSPVTSPAASYPPPPTALTFGIATAETMYRIAMQFYVTDLRDAIADSNLGAAAGATVADAVPAETGVLLGVVHVPVQAVTTPTEGTIWQLQQPPAIPWVDALPTRPILLPLAMLQEAALLAAGAAARAEKAYRVAAAGIAPITTIPKSAETTLYPGLQAIADQINLGDVTVTFPDPVATATTQYIVKVVPIASAATSPVSPPPASGWPVVTLKSFLTTQPGFILHLSLSDGFEPTLAQVTAVQLMIEVSALSP